MVLISGKIYPFDSSTFSVSFFKKRKEKSISEVKLIRYLFF